MKIGKVWLIALMVVSLIIFALNLAYAQDMSIWVGKWLQIKSWKVEGNCDEKGGMKKDYGPITQGYMKFKSWNGGSFQVDEHLFLEGGGWVKNTYDLYCIPGDKLRGLGSELDLLAWAQDSHYGIGDGVATIQLSARIQGKKKSGLLNSATYKTLGEVYIWFGNEVVDYDICAGKITVIANLVAEGKVPIEIR
jgi:hypothetical protein